jgi:hypothetical protein
MSVRYQHGYLRCRKRKNGNSSWEFMWREQELSGNRVHRTVVIGTAEQYPSEELVQEAVRGLRMQIKRSSKSSAQPIDTCRRLDCSLSEDGISRRLAFSCDPYGLS